MTQMTPAQTISVIITNYNYDHYVGVAINSVIAQTRQADEIIVIDDGSTDQSRERIDLTAPRSARCFKKTRASRRSPTPAMKSAEARLSCISTQTTCFIRMRSN